MAKQDPVTKYARAVVRGNIIAGDLLRRTCQRHLDDLERAKSDDYPYRFDIDLSLEVIDFARLCRHYKGPMAGKPFEPDPFQQFILGSCIGWVKKSDGFRRYSEAYVELARKNAKTFLAAILALWFLCMDGESGAEVYSTATKMKQAKRTWDDARFIAKRSPALRGKFVEKIGLLELWFERTDSVFEPLPSDSEKLDGLNPSAAINDELHAQRDRKLYQVVKEGLGSRDQPFIFNITTAGRDLTCFCYTLLHKHAKNVLTIDGYNDERLFIFIACPDEEDYEEGSDGWTKEPAWHKANPALGTAKKVDFVAERVADAKQRPSEENSVKTFQLNIWTAGAKKWLNMARFMKAGRRKFPTVTDAFESLTGRECFAGLDLSSKVDFASVAYLFPPIEDEEHWPLFLRFWIPEATAEDREKTDRIPCDDWRRDGWLNMTPGETIDHERIVNDIIADSETVRIKEIGFDPFSAQQAAVKLDLEGFDMVQMTQNMRTLAEPTGELEVMVLDEKLEHFGNPIICWMAGNAVTIEDANGNMRPDKKKSSDRIDGISATVNALGRSLVDDGDDGESVYETRGPLTFG